MTNRRKKEDLAPVIDGLDGVVKAFEDIKSRLDGDMLAFLSISVDNVICVAKQYKKEFILYEKRKNKR